MLCNHIDSYLFEKINLDCKVFAKFQQLVLFVYSTLTAMALLNTNVMSDRLAAEKLNSLLFIFLQQ